MFTLFTSIALRPSHKIVEVFTFTQQMLQAQAMENISTGLLFCVRAGVKTASSECKHQMKFTSKFKATPKKPGCVTVLY